VQKEASGGDSENEMPPKMVDSGQQTGRVYSINDPNMDIFIIIIDTTNVA